MSWTPFVVALAVFVLSHYLPTATGLRDAAVGRLGRRVYFSVYGAISLAVLVWIIVAAGQAPHVQLWPQAPWLRWVPNIAMPLAFMLTACGIGIAQPFTLGGRRGASFDPAAPGLAAVTRHPLLWALALWAGAHLLANGDLAHVILFGLFLAMALGFIPVFDARARRALGPAAEPFFASSATLSPAPFADRSWRAANLSGLSLRALVGLGIWLAALMLHEAVIGVSPLPI